MKPVIETSEKGEIFIQNNVISNDFCIDVNGKIINRKAVDASDLINKSNELSLGEAGELYDPSINEMIIGYDDEDKLKLTSEAFDFFEEKRCKIKLLPISEAIIYWNRYEGHAIGLFHIRHHHN